MEEIHWILNSNYYNDFTKKIISNAFAEEIDFFEYKFKNQ